MSRHNIWSERLNDVSRSKINTIVSNTLRGKCAQQAIADELKCTQGRVSKIENGYDEDLRFRDVTAYASLTNRPVLDAVVGIAVHAATAAKTRVLSVEHISETGTAAIIVVDNDPAILRRYYLELDKRLVEVLGTGTHFVNRFGFRVVVMANEK